MADLVQLDVTDAVAYVRLDRADKLNALTLDTLQQLVGTARRLSRDRTLRAVVLSGRGDSFCAGLDFATVLREPRRLVAGFAPRPRRGTNTFQEACWAWRRLPVPVVAAVHGHCYGGGLQMALAADIRVTTPDARWSLMEARWGIVPDMTGMQTLSEVVGIDHAKRLAMTGEVLDGREAERLGLVTEVADDPWGAAGRFVEQIRRRSPDQVAAVKRTIGRTWRASPRRTFARERLEQLRLMRSPNTAIARRAAFDTSPDTAEPPAFLPRDPLTG